MEKLSHIGILHLFRLGWEEVGPHLVLSLTAPDYDRSQWLDVKFKLDLDFPNVGGLRRRGKALTVPLLAAAILAPAGSVLGVLAVCKGGKAQGVLELEREDKINIFLSTNKS